MSDVTQQTSEFKALPIDQVAASPLNPRKVFAEEPLQELADSIKEHGLQQPIVVRAKGADDSYEIIMGERRYRACKLAGLTTIPAIIRSDVVTDSQHLELALIENLHRRDIDAIEQAMGYAQLSKMGYSYSQIAQKVNLSQPSIANAMRLLELPETVRAVVQRGELGATHARALIKYSAFPAFLEAIIPYVTERKITTHDLERVLAYQIGDVAVKAKAAVRLKSWDADFDQSVCKACPFKAYVKADYYEYCLKPDHYDQLTKEARKAKKAAAAEAIAAAKADPKAVLQLSAMKHDTFTRIDRKAVEGCSDACSCRSVGKEHDGRVVSICLDPKRYSDLCSAVRRAEEKARGARVQALYDEAVSLLQTLPAAATESALVGYVTDDMFNYTVNQKTVKTVSETLHISAKKQGAGPDVKEMIGTGDGPPSYRRRLSFHDLLKLATGCKLLSEAESARSWGEPKGIERLVHDLRNAAAKTAPSIEEFLQRTASPPAPTPEPYRDCPKCKGLMRIKLNPSNVPIYACGCGHMEIIRGSSDASHSSDLSDPSDPTKTTAPEKVCPDCRGEMLLKYDSDAVPEGWYWCCGGDDCYRQVIAEQHEVPKEAVPA
jgi:ParB/RepB/Spo0J family partition protein